MIYYFGWKVFWIIFEGLEIWSIFGFFWFVIIGVFDIYVFFKVVWGRLLEVVVAGVFKVVFVVALERVKEFDVFDYPLVLVPVDDHLHQQ